MQQLANNLDQVLVLKIAILITPDVVQTNACITKIAVAELAFAGRNTNIIVLEPGLPAAHQWIHATAYTLIAVVLQDIHGMAVLVLKRLFQQMVSVVRMMDPVPTQITSDAVLRILTGIIAVR